MIILNSSGREWSTLRRVAVLLLTPVLANAGVVYQVAVGPVDDNNMALAAPAVTQYFVEDGKVRVGGKNVRMAYLFKDRTMYVIENASRTVHVLKHATLNQATAHYADAVQQLEAAAA